VAVYVVKRLSLRKVRLQGKPFLVYSLPLPAGIGNLFLQTVLGELFALFPLQKFPTKMAVSYHYPLSKHCAAITKEKPLSICITSSAQKALQIKSCVSSPSAPRNEIVKIYNHAEVRTAPINFSSSQFNFIIFAKMTKLS